MRESFRPWFVPSRLHLLWFFFLAPAFQASLFSQLVRFDDPARFTDRSVRIHFGEFRNRRSPAGDSYRGFGVRFIGEGGSVPTTDRFLLDPSINPAIDTVLRNEPDGESAGLAMIVQLDRPSRRVGIRLGNGTGETTARLEAFAPAGESLGVVEVTGVDPIRGPFVGLETDHPEGISTVTLDYGDDPAGEQINDFFFEPLSDLPLQTCVAQIAHGRAGNKLVRTMLQIHVSAQAKLRVFDDSGNPLVLTLSGQQGSEFDLPSAGGRGPQLIELVTEGSGETPQSGYACIESYEPVSANSLYQVLEENGDLTSEAGVLAEQAGVLFFIPMEQRPSLGLDTGVAVVNLSDQPNVVELLLLETDGIARPPELIVHPFPELAPGEHRAFFLSQFCQLEFARCANGEDGLSGVEFLGTLLIVAEHPVAVTALRTSRGLPLSSLAAGSFQRYALRWLMSMRQVASASNTRAYSWSGVSEAFPSAPMLFLGRRRAPGASWTGHPPVRQRLDPDERCCGQPEGWSDDEQRKSGRGSSKVFEGLGQSAFAREDFFLSQHRSLPIDREPPDERPQDQSPRAPLREPGSASRPELRRCAWVARSFVGKERAGPIVKSLVLGVTSLSARRSRSSR